MGSIVHVRLTPQNEKYLEEIKQYFKDNAVLDSTSSNKVINRLIRNFHQLYINKNSQPFIKQQKQYLDLKNGFNDTLENKKLKYTEERVDMNTYLLVQLIKDMDPYASKFSIAESPEFDSVFRPGNVANEYFQAARNSVKRDINNRDSLNKGY